MQYAPGEQSLTSLTFTHRCSVYLNTLIMSLNLPHSILKQERKARNYLE